MSTIRSPVEIPFEYVMVECDVSSAFAHLTSERLPHRATPIDPSWISSMTHPCQRQKTCERQMSSARNPAEVDFDTAPLDGVVSDASPYGTTW